MQRINIHSIEKGARIVYVLNFVCIEVLKCQWQFTNERSEADIVYGNENTGGFTIKPSSFIKEGARADSRVFENGELFLNNEDFFDPLAAIFFCLSRSEEYDAEVDAHQRFSGRESVFYGFLEKPWVDIWIRRIATVLKTGSFETTNFQMTVDLDFGYRFLGKGWVRNLGGLTKDLVKLNLANAYQRIQAIVLNKDPYDKIYQWLTSTFNPSELQFFALSAPFSKFDKGLELGNKAWRRLIDVLDEYEIGLHPSYYQLQKDELLKAGKCNLESFGVNIKSNRFHFLRFALPDSYQKLLDVGISNDYSMGFADMIGFRAQTSRSFLFYNLQLEKVTALRVHPFVCMDAVLCNYATLTPLEMLQVIGSVVDEIKQLGGTICLLWHEHTLVDSTETKALLDKILPLVKPMRNA